MLFFKEICEAMGYCCSARQPAELSCGFVSCQFSNFQFPSVYMCTTCTSTSTGYTAEVNKSLS